MTDIVERLRERARSLRGLGDIAHIDAATDEEAADLIERLRAALRELHDEMDEYQRINNLSAYNNHVMRQARTALAQPASEQEKSND